MRTRRWGHRRRPFRVPALRSPRRPPRGDAWQLVGGAEPEPEHERQQPRRRVGRFADGCLGRRQLLHPGQPQRVPQPRVALGWEPLDGGGPAQRSAKHWDGTAWHVVPSPNPAPNGDELFGIAAADPHHVYVVGQQLGTGFPSLALAERWNGHDWQVLSAPASSTASYDPFAATTVGPHLLAVGDPRRGREVTPDSAASPSRPTARPGRSARTRPAPRRTRP